MLFSRAIAIARRLLHAQHRSSSIRLLSSSSPPLPWFVDPPSVVHAARSPFDQPAQPPLPEGVPQALRALHATLSNSPHLEPSTLLVRNSLPIPPGPLLPYAKPRGRRNRGGTYFGEGVLDAPTTLWNWIVLAQVKEGTETRGAIESVVRIVRKTLLSMNPPLSLPPNTKRRAHNGWHMIDAGDIAIHVLSREAREKYFNERSDLLYRW